MLPRGSASTADPPPVRRPSAGHPSAPYRPSNGFEGSIFIENWCVKCAMDAGYSDDAPWNGCQILAKSFRDGGVPEWIADDTLGTNARCAAFVTEFDMGLIPDERQEAMSV
jgi:hypothetical protein